MPTGAVAGGGAAGGAAAGGAAMGGAAAVGAAAVGAAVVVAAWGACLRGGRRSQQQEARDRAERGDLKGIIFAPQVKGWKVGGFGGLDRSRP